MADEVRTGVSSLSPYSTLQQCKIVVHSPISCHSHGPDQHASLCHYIGLRNTVHWAKFATSVSEIKKIKIHHRRKGKGQRTRQGINRAFRASRVQCAASFSYSALCQHWLFFRWCHHRRLQGTAQSMLRCFANAHTHALGTQVGQM